MLSNFTKITYKTNYYSNRSTIMITQHKNQVKHSTLKNADCWASPSLTYNRKNLSLTVCRRDLVPFTLLKTLAQVCRWKGCYQVSSQKRLHFELSHFGLHIRVQLKDVASANFEISY